MIFSDWTGSIGVSLLLIAFVLILTNQIPKNGMMYLLMNFAGSGLATVASYLIHYLPFVILESVWMLASLFGMWRLYKEKAAK